MNLTTAFNQCIAGYNMLGNWEFSITNPSMYHSVIKKFLTILYKLLFPLLTFFGSAFSSILIPSDYIDEDSINHLALLDTLCPDSILVDQYLPGDSYQRGSNGRVDQKRNNAMSHIYHHSYDGLEEVYHCVFLLGSMEILFKFYNTNGSTTIRKDRLN